MGLDLGSGFATMQELRGENPYEPAKATYYAPREFRGEVEKVKSQVEEGNTGGLVNRIDKLQEAFTASVNKGLGTAQDYVWEVEDLIGIKWGLLREQGQLDVGSGHITMDEYRMILFETD